ncbi:MAG: hypothetical protein V7607_5426 [Solirubrobacteraceae bacterium]
MLSLPQLVATQSDYYQRWADEYTAWIEDYMRPVRAELWDRLRKIPAIRGKVLELACGSGYFTELLSQVASGGVVAFDGSTRMLELLSQRRLAGVSKHLGDIFSWTPQPDDQFDCIFMAHWLSHVPPSHLAPFFAKLAQALRPGGSVIIVDVTEEERRFEISYRTERGIPIVERTLTGKEVIPIVKVYWDPALLLSQLRAVGWDGTHARAGGDVERGFVVYELRRDA